MMAMATQYELTGRTRQKARTRGAMVDAARSLLAEGTTPTVEQAAARAGVSRTTAYRYFANQRALLMAGYPELDQTSLLGPDPPADPLARLDLVTASISRQLLANEAEFRAMLLLSLQTPTPDESALPLRQGRAIGWIEDALTPLRGRLGPAERRRLALAIRAVVGIEPFVWLTDVGGLQRDDAVELMRSSARTLLRAALDEA
jgi:AcrR family transcriptional regulator